jgi:hypothetical protein
MSTKNIPPLLEAPETKQAYRNGYDDGAAENREELLNTLIQFALYGVPEGYEDCTAKTNGEWLRKIRSLQVVEAPHEQQ